MTKIHYFNPGHEYAVLNREPSYTPPANMQKMREDLAALPIWYANEDEVVLVDDYATINYYSQLEKKGFNLPRLTVKEDIKTITNPQLALWGISPMAIRFFEALNKTYHQQIILPKWEDEFVYLTSRMASCDVLSQIILSSNSFQAIHLPSFYKDIESIKCRIEKSSEVLLAKAPFSSSGKGLLWLPSGELKQSERQILQGILNKQQTVSIETVYHKVQDFAMEFMSDGRGSVTFEGYSVFFTNEKGGYTNNVLKNEDKLENDLLSFISSEVLEEAKVLLITQLENLYATLYAGCIGVDMMIVRIGNEYQLHPCVEINMRYNMGYLSLKLMNTYVDRESEGVFCLDFDKANAMIKHQKMMQQYPLILKNGKVQSGYLSLCSVDEKTKYRAYLLIH